MQRIAAAFALVIAGTLLSGCVYNPYTGTFMPCCGYYGYYGNPYYRYPGPYSPYGYPPQYGAPQPAPYQGQPGMYQGQPGTDPAAPGQRLYQAPPADYQTPGGYAAPPHPSSSVSPNGTLAQRFAAANVTHDGRLTREQAQQGMPRIAENFDAIDVDQKGYVTLPEIRTFIRRQVAAGGQRSTFDQDCGAAQSFARLTPPSPAGLDPPGFLDGSSSPHGDKGKDQAQIKRMGRKTSRRSSMPA